MKLSTKILIGLLAATMLFVFFGPIIFTGMVRRQMTKMTVTCGPVKTIRISSVDSDLSDDYRLLCQIHSGDVNEAVLISGWPNAAVVDMDYSQIDSTLIIHGDLSSGSARITVTLADPDLQSLVASGKRTNVYVSGVNLPMLMVNTDDSRLWFRESYVSNMLLKESCSSSADNEDMAALVKIKASSKVDTLFYSVDNENAVQLNDNVAVLIGLPGSKALIDSCSADDDTFSVIISDTDDTEN